MVDYVPKLQTVTNLWFLRLIFFVWHENNKDNFIYLGTLFGTKYSRMDQVKFVEDSL